MVGWVKDRGTAGCGDDSFDVRGVFLDRVEEVDGTLDGRVKDVFNRVGDVEMVGGCGVDDMFERWVGLDGLRVVLGGKAGGCRRRR